MRFASALALTFLLVAPVASSIGSDAHDTLAVSILGVEPGVATISWTPAPAGVIYNVYRGPSKDALELIAQTASTAFLDEETPVGDVWYVIVAQEQAGEIGDLVGKFRGSCVSHRGTTGVTVTAAHCIPTRPL